MPDFHYRGRNQQGQLVQGKLVGETAEDIAAQLIKEKITPVQIKSIDSAGSLLQSLKNISIFNKISTDDLIIFSRQMHSLSKAGIPITMAVLRLAETMHNPKFSQALYGVAKNLAAGQNLANSMLQYPTVFNNFIVKLVQVGEKTGQLSEIFLQIVEYLQLENNAVKNTKTAFHYPVIVILVSVTAMLVISFFVIPAFAKLYSQFHSQLPLPTRIIFAFSMFLRNNWFYLLAGLIIITFIISQYFKRPAVRLWWGKCQMQLPIVGDLVKKIILARFTRTFAIVIRTDIPVVEGIDLAANVGNNQYARQNILKMKDAIEHGETITAAAANTGFFTPLVLQMLAVGEETGRSDEMLLEVSDFYEQEVEVAIKKLSEDVNVILLLGVAGVVLFLALGVFLPIWDMTSFAKT